LPGLLAHADARPCRPARRPTIATALWVHLSGRLSKPPSPTMRVRRGVRPGDRRWSGSEACTPWNSSFVPRPLQEACLELVTSPAWPRHCARCPPSCATAATPRCRRPGTPAEVVVPTVPQGATTCGCGCPTGSTRRGWWRRHCALGRVMPGRVLLAATCRRRHVRLSYAAARPTATRSVRECTDCSSRSPASLTGRAGHDPSPARNQSAAARSGRRRGIAGYHAFSHSRDSSRQGGGGRPLVEREPRPSPVRTGVRSPARRVLDLEVARCIAEYGPGPLKVARRVRPDAARPEHREPARRANGPPAAGRLPRRVRVVGLDEQPHPDARRSSSTAPIREPARPSPPARHRHRHRIDSTHRAAGRTATALLPAPPRGRTRTDGAPRRWARSTRARSSATTGPSGPGAHTFA